MPIQNALRPSAIPATAVPLSGPASESVPEPPGAVTRLLQRWSDGDRQALDRVLPMVYDELRRMAQRHLRHERDGHTLQGTGLVHEAFIKLAQQQGPVQWESRGQFMAWASALMRHILVDHARARQAQKRDAGTPVESLDALMQDTVAHAAVSAQAADSGTEHIDLIALDRALQRLETLDPQQGRVVELRFFGGLSVTETAEALGISAATVKREWATARAWLLRELGHGGSTRPAALDPQVLATARRS